MEKVACRLALILQEKLNSSNDWYVLSGSYLCYLVDQSRDQRFLVAFICVCTTLFFLMLSVFFSSFRKNSFHLSLRFRVKTHPTSVGDGKQV